MGGYGEAMRLVLQTPLGHTVVLETTPQTWLEDLRTWGAKGFRPAAPPPGGFVLPLECHRCFDWAFLGATAEGEYVQAFGYRWKRRHLPARQGLPEQVKYSRGAWQYEEEGIEGKRQGYVTLIRFEGPGRCGLWCRR